MGLLTYTTQEVQDRLDSVGQMVRPNLLDNAYFIGGGSQQGGGQFPISQRGNSSWTSLASGNYVIDRWYTISTTSANLVAAGLSFPAGTNYGLAQKLENPTQYIGKKMTLSMLVTGLSGGNITVATISSDGSYHQETRLTITTTGLASATFTVPSTISQSGYFGIRFYGASGASPAYTVAAVKLELGDTQTLAHWDESTQSWLLNEIPNYQQELAKCQRYFLRLNALSGTTTHFALAMGESTTSANAVVSLPATMRTTPSASFSGTVNLRAGTTDYAVTSVSTNNHSENAVYLNLKVSSGLSAGALYAARVAGGYVNLSADL